MLHGGLDTWLYQVPSHNHEYYMTEPIVRMECISKSFPGGVLATQEASLTVEAGEIHAIVGENGAGKSTLMNVLYGLLQADEGAIYFNEKDVEIDSPRTAKALGIGMVHQHFMLVPSFSVLQNIILGYEPTHRGLIVDNDGAKDSVATLCQNYHLEVPLDEPVQNLPVGWQQRVEIIKAIYRGANVLILDEPTAVLTPLEVEELYKICWEMKWQNKTILFISHKLREVLELSDRITVMRKGRTMATLNAAGTDESELARLIVGRERLWTIDREIRGNRSDPIMQIKDLSVLNANGSLAVDRISLVLNRGEILGLVGVEGNGQTELVEAITGLRPSHQGTISLGEEEITERSVADRRSLGIGHIPQDRMGKGLSLEASISENFIIDQPGRAPFRSRLGVLDWKRVKSHTQEKIRNYKIVVPGPDALARTLSGGNLQKIVAARELSRENRCLLAVHLTRGLDIGAAEFIYRQLLKAREEGGAVLLVSADLDEILKISDRLVVMYEGKIVGEFSPEKATPEELGLFMTGAI